MRRYNVVDDIQRDKRDLEVLIKLHAKSVLTKKEQQKYLKLRHRLGGLSW